MAFTYVHTKAYSAIPRASGVYVFLKGKTILYIGKAANLRDRVKNHFQQPSYRDNFFMHEVAAIGYEETESEIDALLLESAYIKKHQPKYNVMWKDDKKYFFVALTREPFPRVFITHQPFVASAPQGHSDSKSHQARSPLTHTGGKGAERSEMRMQYIGPFVDGKALKHVLRLLRRVFPYWSLKKHPAVSCPYCHLGLCPGPAPNPTLYKKNITNLAAVLQGKKRNVLHKLEKEMRQASKTQAYEKAAQARDQMLAFQSILEHASLFKRNGQDISAAHDYTFVETELQKVFTTHKPIARIEAYDISNIQGTHATGSQVAFVQGKPAKQFYRKFKIRISGKSNDFAMMQELVARRIRHAEWGLPDLMIIDGGKGQLSAAQKGLGNADILISAIAKRHNELFLPSLSKPVLLATLPLQVQNLILHIRDEAHRFAITYHKVLRRIDLVGRKR